jgi:hypothetical protein
MKQFNNANSVGKLLIASLLLSLVLLLLSFTFSAAPSARAQGPVQGGRGAVAPTPKIGSGYLTQVGSTTLARVDWAAAGTGMRNRGYGAINISSIPNGSKVQLAFLYWDVLDYSPASAYSRGYLNGNSVNGAIVGMDLDPCWLSPQGNNFAYRANVTSLVTGNGAYSLSGFASGLTNGADPWSSSVSLPLIDGASLIVFYSNPALPLNFVQLYDGSRTLIGSGSNTYTLTMSGLPALATIHKAKTTFVMGDGQTNYTPATDTVWFNNFLLPFQFNGADPQSGPNYSNGNLWDTISQDVTSYVPANSTSATAKVTTSECLVWVAQVLSIR